MNLKTAQNNYDDDKCVCCSDELFSIVFASLCSQFKGTKCQGQALQNVNPFLGRNYFIPWRKTFCLFLNKAFVYLSCAFFPSYPWNNEFPFKQSSRFDKVSKRKRELKRNATSRHYVSLSSNSNLMNLIVFTLGKDKVLRSAITGRVSVWAMKTKETKFFHQKTSQNA